TRPRAEGQRNDRLRRHSSKPAHAASSPAGNRRSFRLESASACSSRGSRPLMEPLSDRLALVAKHVQRAVNAADADAAASPVLRAVVQEFQRKLVKATQILSRGAAAPAQREAVVEVEQAADSAQVAAHADPGANAETRKAVELAHTAMCL